MKPPLRTVLRNFLNHFEDYEARKKLCDDQYELEFQQLKKLTDRLRDDPEYTCSCALKDVNRPKNRYKDIVPYDKSRVVLPKCDGIPGSDYINASYVKGASGAFAYIAAQGPLPNTVIDFWRMIWVCDVQVLIMACNEKEAGKNKCETYWPPNKGEVKQYGNISVELIETSQVCPDFLVRTLLVKCDTEMRDVYQFHYTSWPDHGVPDTVHPILELVRLMRDCQASETVPIVVHCSAGCGRTGTICAVDFVWACLRHGKLSEDFSLFEIALELRRQRIAMIQTKEQYILAHKAVATLFEQQLNVIDCHTYVNVDEDGEPLMWKELSKNKFTLFKNEKSTVNDNYSNNGAADEKLEQNFSSNSKDSIIKTAERFSSKNASDISETNSMANYKLNAQMSISDSLINSGKSSETSLSRNSYLSQQGSEDTIPFIDDDEVCVRPHCGRAYLNMPISDSFSKLINRFDPFVDKVTLDTDDSSPDGDPSSFPKEMADLQSSSKNSNCDEMSMNSSKCEVNSNSDLICSGNYATLPSGSTINKNHGKGSNRESYPPSGFARYDDSVSDLGEEGDSICKGLKKVGKATVVRRPSISKLKALFEKSSKSSGEGGKRSLFRHNSHSVSRAGSAPPSLNCMDKNAAVERESILMLVTRKFRSASVRTEREISSKPYDKSQYRKSTPGSLVNFKEGLSTLSRTVSFNLSRTFRSYSPSKSRVEKSPISESGHASFRKDSNPSASSKSKLPDIQPKGKSMWYDKSSLPRAIAVVKPTEKVSLAPDTTTTDVPKSPTAKRGTEKGALSSVINKPPKLLPFFSTLSRSNGRDMSTMWYNEIDENSSSVETAGIKTASECDVEPVKLSHKSHSNRVLPFIQSITPWKKNSPKSPLNSPESPKTFFGMTPETNNVVSNSKFYTEIENNLSGKSELQSKGTQEEIPACPVPEEIIPLDNVLEKSNSSQKKTNGEPLNETVLQLKKGTDPVDQQSNNSGSVEKPEKVAENVEDKNTVTAERTIDLPPAIPKKMVIGKQKHLENQIFFNEHEVLPNMDLITSDNKNSPNRRKDSVVKPVVEGKVESPSLSPKDHYINVNVKTLKNIEQIENTLRNNPRGAIIDLTSRESYCMEEDLNNALKQLSEPQEENQTCAAKPNSKFPGYEVIWPDGNYSKDNFALNADLKSKFRIQMLKDANNLAAKHGKTGLCYSPPLRRSINASLGLSKCRSCSNIDWLEPDENVSGVENSKASNITPTKKLVTEAVVELNTLLDQLTTRTLAEDPELDSKSSQTAKIAVEKNDFPNNKWQQKDHLMTHSVTIVSKSNALDSSSKEEEIVFHFPPPPPLPPPKDQPSETFNIVRKNGAIIIAEKSQTKECATDPLSMRDHSSGNKNPICDSVQIFPQPAPRKSKQGGLRRSASYTNMCVPQSKTKGYENIFLEKYQTLSRLQIDSKSTGHEQNNETEVTINVKPSRCKPQVSKSKPDYVNVKELSISGSPKLVRSSPKNDAIIKSNVEHANQPLTHVDMSQSCPPCDFKTDSSFSLQGDKNSTYGKICKMSGKQLPSSEKGRNPLYVNTESILSEVRKKPLPSKKTERAPLPPDVVQSVVTKETIPQKTELTKKLPSRKMEKAPLPPPLLQKSATAINIAKKNLPNTPYYMNYSSSRTHIADETPILPALHENVSNNELPNSALNANPPKPEIKNNRSPVLSHGLSHSRSDASVFLALKERKTQSLIRGLKIDSNPKLMNKVLRQKKEMVSVSSSDSDSSYERIFFDKPTEQLPKAASKHSVKEQIILNSPKSYKKELPIAPPRSRRRNTTEIHYAKVKSKEASPFTDFSTNIPYQQKLPGVSPVSEPPPAIPLKTKDAFEIPDEFGIKGNDRITDKGLDNACSNFKR